MTADSYDTPDTPPATPPTIDPDADPVSAAELAEDRAGDTDEPGQTPDEIVPDEGDLTNPTHPDEIEIEQGDTDEPGKVPASPEIQMPPD